VLEKVEAPDERPGSPQFWWKLGVSVVLILGGGVFAGLTIALMGQDVINVHTILIAVQGLIFSCKFLPNQATSAKGSMQPRCFHC
jgi:hypothetical protein